jgi:hypothetical protein
LYFKLAQAKMGRLSPLRLQVTVGEQLTEEHSKKHAGFDTDQCSAPWGRFTRQPTRRKAEVAAQAGVNPTLLSSGQSVIRLLVVAEQQLRTGKFWPKAWWVNPHAGVRSRRKLTAQTGNDDSLGVDHLKR